MNEKEEKLHEIQLKSNQWDSLKKLIIITKWKRRNENAMNILMQ